MKFPTGGDCGQLHQPASAWFWFNRNRGQQIRCDSGVDGHSPDERERDAAVVCCGLVIDGGIYRHDFVADAVISGLMSVQLATGVPVFSAVLTPLHFHEHEEHRRFFTAHFLAKGTEAAQACLQTVASLQKIEAFPAS